MNHPKDDDLFLSIFEELKQKYTASNEEKVSLSEHYLTEEIDHEILKQRDAHFAGDFKVMHDYYREERLRQHPDIELERIEYLAHVEAKLSKNLSNIFLSEEEKREVAAALQAYEALKEVYLDEEKQELFPRLIADLILAEDDEADEEIQQIVAQGSAIVPALIKLIESNEAYNPLFPGYGYAPYLAMVCLGRIKDPAAIAPLFEQLHRDMLFDEQVVLEALKQIGESAKHYLLKQIAFRPITKENTLAAYALTYFSEEEDVAKAAFENLKDPDTAHHTLFATYLIFNLASLQEGSLKKEILAWSAQSQLPPSLQKELKEILE
jgi:hypothetical protein